MGSGVKNNNVHFIVIKTAEAYFAHFEWPSQFETHLKYRQEGDAPYSFWWLQSNSGQTDFGTECATFEEALGHRETIRKRMETPMIGGHLTDGGYFIDSTQFNDTGGYKIWHFSSVQ